MKTKPEAIYIIAIADKEGNFDWVYTDPKPFYETRKEASDVLDKIRENETSITFKNSKIQKLWKVKNL